MKGWKKMIFTCALVATTFFGVACGEGDGSSSSSGGGQTLADICMRKVETQLADAKVMKFDYAAALHGNTGTEFELLAGGAGTITLYAQEDELAAEISYTQVEGESVYYCLTQGKLYQKNSVDAGYLEIGALPEGLPVTLTEAFQTLFTGIELGEGEFFNALSDYTTANAIREDDSLTLTVEQSTTSDLLGESALTASLVFEKTVGLHDAAFTLVSQKTQTAGEYAWFGTAVQAPSEIRTAFLFELTEINTEGSLGEITVFEYPLMGRLDFAYTLQRKTAVVKKSLWELVLKNSGNIYRFTLQIYFDGSEYNYVIEGAATPGEIQSLDVRVVGYQRIEQGRVTGIKELAEDKLSFTVTIDWENKVADFSDLQIRKFWTGNY